MAFVGRALEMERARAVLEGAASGQGALLLVSGDAGLGKTRFLQELAARAAPRWRSLWGHAQTDVSRPYAPFGELLEGYARVAEPAAIRDDLELAGPAAAELTADLQEFVRGDVDASLPPTDRRLRLFDSTTQFLLAASRRRPLLIVLDDAQECDSDSTDLLAHFAGSVAGERIVVALCYRDEAREAPFASAFPALMRLPNVTRIDLGPLAEGDVRQLLADIDERAGKDLVARVAHDTAGNPLFAREVMLALVATGRFDARETDGEPLPLPDSIAAAVRGRLRRMSGPANMLLTAASATPERFTLEVTARAADLDDAPALDALDEALASRMVRASEGSVYAFEHALIGQAVFSLLNPSRQERLHRRIAEATVQVYGARAGEHARSIAGHYHRSRSLPGAEAGATYALDAASGAERAAAFDDRVRLLSMGLDMTPLADASYARTLGLLAAALAAAGRFEETVDRAKQAAQLIDRQDGPEDAAAFIEDLMGQLTERFPMSHAWTIAQEGLRRMAARGSERWCRLRMYALVAEEYQRPEFAGILTCDDPEWADLFDLCERNGWTPVFYPLAPPTRAEVLARHRDHRAMMLLFAGDLQRSRLLYRVDERQEGPLAAAIGWARVSLCNAALGDLAGAASDLQRAAWLAARAGVYHGGAASALGDATYALTFVRHHGWERLARDTDAMIGARGEAFGIDAANAVVTAAVAHAYAGDPEATLDRLSRVESAIDAGNGRMYGYTRLVCLATETRWALGRADDSADLLERKLRDEIIAPDFRQPGVDARRSLALLCALRGDRDAASRWLAAARHTLAEQGARPLLAIVDFDEATMLASGPNEAGRADALARSALEQFRALDMRGWATRAEDLLQRLADRGGAVPRRALPDGLTAREGEVLRLIAMGRTNREISHDLTLSVRTVARHITNIYGKIGARGKADATAYAIRHGLV